MGFPLFSPFPLSLRQDLSSTYFLAFFLQASIILLTQLHCFIGWYVLIVLNFELPVIFVRIYPFAKHHKRSIDLFRKCLENFWPQLLHYLTFFFLPTSYTSHPRYKVILFHISEYHMDQHH